MGFDIHAVTKQTSQSIDSIGQQIADIENSSPDGNISDEDMQKLQMLTDQWSIMMQMETAMEKSWSDAMQAVARNL